MRSEWKTKALGDLVTFSSGGTPSKQNPSYWGGNIPWISAKTMKSERISSSDLMITEEGLAAGSRMAPVESILLLTRGSGLFKGIPICLVERPVAYNQDVKCLEAQPGVNIRFIYYWLKSQEPFLKARLEVTGIGAGKFDTKLLSELAVPLPNQIEQSKIVSFADAISEKIIANKQINDHLEQQAAALYEKYFPYAVTDELPIGWRIGTIGEIVEIHDSKRIPLSGAQRAKMKKPRYPYYGAASLMDYVDEYIFDGKYLLLGEDGTVVDDAGYPILQYVWGQFWVNNHAHILTGKLGFNVETLLLLFKRTPVKSIVTGAVQPKISQANLRSIKVVVPPQSELKAFSELICPLFDQIRQNQDQNKALTAMRDALLPKLMSGELDVSAVQL